MSNEKVQDLKILYNEKKFGLKQIELSAQSQTKSNSDNYDPFEYLRNAALSA